MRRMLLGILGAFLLAGSAWAVTLSADATCPNGPNGEWAIGHVSVQYDANGNVTGGNVAGICLDGKSAPIIPPDGVVCFCPPLSGTGKDLFCKAHADVSPSTTIGSCIKSATATGTSSVSAATLTGTVK